MSYLPELRASLVKAAHRQRAMAAKDHDQRTRSAGGRRRPRTWLRPSIGGVATLLAVASTIAVVVVALTVAAHRHPASTAHRGSSVAANDAAARAAAARSLSQLVLPPGAVASGLVPGTPAELWSPADRLAMPHRFDVHRIWRLPGPPDAAINFIQSHQPASSQGGGTSESASGRGSGPISVHVATTVFRFPASPGSIISRQLAVEAVALPGGGTALRADGEAGWVVPISRSAGELIPAGADSVEATTIRRIPRQASLHRTIVVNSRARIHALVGVINGLPTAHPRARRCMNASDLLVRFVFHHEGEAMPLATASYDVACNRLRLAIGGRPQADRQIDVSGQGQQFIELMSFAKLR